MKIDLKNNTVDDKSLPPKVVELLAVLYGNTWMHVSDIVKKVWGVNEPSDAENSVGHLAWRARKLGFNVIGQQKLGYRLFV
jgi:hypothetical protein